MIELYFLLFGSLFFMLIFGMLFSLIFKKEMAISKRTEDYFGIEDVEAPSKVKKEKSKLFVALGEWSTKIKSWIDRITPIASKKQLEQRLREAGYPMKMTPIDFRFMQFLIGSMLFIAMYALMIRAEAALFSSIVLSVIIALTGMYYFSFNISSLIKKRRLQIQKQMPDFFDMVNLSIEAGLGLDASLMKVCEKMKGPLADEFMQTLEDMRLGKARREAFGDLRNRVQVPQFQSIISSLIQADMLGIGMAKALRQLTERIREQRVQFAREQANKAPVKMIFPMMFFIFPAIFIVLLGPMVIYLIEYVL